MLLDMACGTGRLTRTVYQPNRKIINADYSQQMLLDARSKAQSQGIPFHPVRVDGFCLPFKPQTFEAVFTMRFIRHYKEPERIKLYSEIRRVLKTQGILIFEVLNSAIDKDAPNRPVHDEAYNLEEISQELEKNGFSLKARLAGNIVKNSLFVILKKWSLISLGRRYARRLRSRKIHLDNAAYWMVYARKSDL
jgi:ubiquinone/menaquinone biosynthesis C-methylase UbiE